MRTAAKRTRSSASTSTTSAVTRKEELAEDPVASSSDRVAKAIANSVLTGRWFPGQRLIESDLARDLQVSRGTVREAFKRLAAERVIALTLHRGAYVRVLTREEALELLQVLTALYGLAATLAAAAIDKGDNRQRFAAAYERLRDDGPRTDRIIHTIDRGSFWEVFLDIGGNRELIRMNPAAPTQILRMQVHPYLTSADLEALFADYKLIYDAVTDGDGKRAKRALETHTRRRAEQAARLPPEAFSSGWTNPL
jgi:DNA-binding GntR family transcriptional regulator